MLSGRERRIYDLLPVHTKRNYSSARHARCIDYRVDSFADQNIVVSWIEYHDCLSFGVSMRPIAGGSASNAMTPSTAPQEGGRDSSGRHSRCHQLSQPVVRGATTILCRSIQSLRHPPVTATSPLDAGHQLTRPVVNPDEPGRSPVPCTRWRITRLPHRNRCRRARPYITRLRNQVRSAATELLRDSG